VLLNVWEWILRSKSGNRYALVLQDYLTKWPEVYAVPDRKADTVVKCLMDFIWKHGTPNRIIHDRAAEFLSEVLQETARLVGVTQLPTSEGHPQMDGLVERLNRTLKQMLTKLVSKGGSDWDTLLGPVLFAYRTTPHTSSGESPFYLVYGRDARIPSSVSFSAPIIKYSTLGTEYGQALFQELQSARNIAQRSIGKAQQSQKCNYDKKSTGSHLKGDLCMLKVEPRFRLDRGFKGPFRIQSLTATNAVIKPMNDCNGKPINVSRQRLSKCSPLMEIGNLWLEHSGKLHCHRQIQRDTTKEAQKEVDTAVSTPTGMEAQPSAKQTRHGRLVRKPARFLLVGRQDGLPKKGGGSCKDGSVQG